ncbi:MAG: CDP-diacylglycerol--serine O-phosphatidyltransferase [Bacteroidales bacterium]|nr:CDP-diacylglycerol--serine O-phosphatidyltransferase [Bacteroidales bacterium]
MKKHIPNTLTCLNLICGTLSVMAAVKGNLEMAAIWIIIAAVFDFFDGFAARMLKVASPIGKELDSLSDVVSFGVAPAMIIYTWLNRCLFEMQPALSDSRFMELMPFIALLVPALSAVRLARFNIDERQTTTFIGLPTPANALFLGFIPLAADKLVFLNNFWVVWSFTLLFALLLVSPISMISLKFKDLKFKGINIARYTLIITGLVLIPVFHWGAFPLIILAYILISLFFHTLEKLQVI